MTEGAKAAAPAQGHHPDRDARGDRGDRRVFAAMGGNAAAPEKPRSEWASPARRMRRPHVHYRGAWQASARGGR